MTGLRSQRSMKGGFTPTPVCSELGLFSREAISLIEGFERNRDLSSIDQQRVVFRVADRPSGNRTPRMTMALRSVNLWSNRARFTQKKAIAFRNFSPLRSQGQAELFMYTCTGAQRLTPITRHSKVFPQHDAKEVTR
jgi:hypothetical protein